MNDEFITINDRKIATESRILNIFDIEFYPENPRINYILSKYGSNLTQDIIEEKLWSQDSVKLLAEDIERNGGLIEEIIVYRGKVVEGNSRLCAYRKIYSKANADEKPRWRYIKCKIITAEIRDSELMFLLGQYHLRGKTPWDPFEKASYINKMLTVDQFTEKDVALNFGMREASIKVQNKAYKLMKEQYLPKITDIEEEHKELKKFSIFEEYYKNQPLQELRDKRPDIINEYLLIEWVREGRIRSAAYDVRKDLFGILNNKAARNDFLESAPEDAISSARIIVYKDHPEMVDNFYLLMKNMTEQLRDSNINEVLEKFESNGSTKQIITHFRSEVKKFYRNLGIGF